MENKETTDTHTENLGLDRQAGSPDTQCICYMQLNGRQVYDVQLMEEVGDLTVEE